MSFTEKIHTIMHQASDTVAVAVTDGIQADTVLNTWIMDEDRIALIKALMPIPLGHKMAVMDLAPGDGVKKYGELIGKVTAPIKQGELVHVHNLSSARWGQK